MPKRESDRWPEAYEMRLAGKTYKEIGGHFGVTPEMIARGLKAWLKRNNMDASTIQGKARTTSTTTTTTKKQAKPTSPPDDILTLLQKPRKPRSLEDICSATGLTKRVAQAVIADLIEEGYNIEEVNGEYLLAKYTDPRKNQIDADWDGAQQITFAVVSDTHMGSVHEQLTFLNDLYDYFASRGVTTVYHAGDITEGDYNNRPGHIYERHKHGVDQQADYVIEHYPYRDGIETHFITGNHDYTHIRNGGADIGRKIAREREDMVFLGWDNARINLTPNCVLELNHPGDGSPYSISYSIQKYIETLPSQDKPQILFQGHHHKALYLMYRGIHAFEAGCTQAQSNWMRSKRLAAHVGAWVVTVHVDEEGVIKHLVPEFIPQAEHLVNDYK